MHRKNLAGGLYTQLHHFIGKNNTSAIVVLSSSILPIMHSRCCVYSARISDIEIAEGYSRSPRVSPAVTPVRGFGGEKTMLQRPEPLSSRWRSFSRALLSPFSLYLVGPLSSPFTLSLPPVPLLSPPSGENSSACLYVWSRATRYNATPGCIVNQTRRRRQHDDG